MRISDWSSDVCSSDLVAALEQQADPEARHLTPHEVPGYGGVGDDPDLGVVALELQDHLEPVHAGHEEIEDDGVDRLLSALLEHPIGRAPCREHVCKYV